MIWIRIKSSKWITTEHLSSLVSKVNFLGQNNILYIRLFMEINRKIGKITELSYQKDNSATKSDRINKVNYS